jgi:hypothetical protein
MIWWRGSYRGRYLRDVYINATMKIWSTVDVSINYDIYMGTEPGVWRVFKRIIDKNFNLGSRKSLSS